MSKRLIVGLLSFVCLLSAQRRVDPRNTYNRIMAVVPITGKGIAADPKRPEYAPWPASQDPNGIIGFYWIPTDDGKSAIVEFVARNRAAFSPLFNDKSIQVYEKGRVTREIIEAAMKAFRKDFDYEKNGLVMP
jgi:hypothetical protein